MATKPTIVIVPAAFSLPAHYALVINGLNELGYEVHVAALESARESPVAPTPGMQDDVAALRKLVEKLVDEGKELILDMHSYGGIVGTEACEGLGKAEREAAGKKGGIIRLLYVAATVAPVGSINLQMFQSDMPDPEVRTFDGQVVEMDRTNLPPSFEGLWLHLNDPQVVVDFFFNDVPPEVASNLASGVAAQALRVQFEPQTYAGYNNIPASYLLTKRDRVVPPEYQQNFIKTLEEASGGSCDVHAYNVGHCVHVTKPEYEIEVIRKIAGEIPA